MFVTKFAVTESLKRSEEEAIVSMFTLEVGSGRFFLSEHDLNPTAINIYNRARHS